jgi:uncharacterized protein YdiU (UPF0061 family)
MGLTIDYGPYAFLESYDEDYTPNGSDGSGRYTFKNQPDICKWNLDKLAEALDPELPLGEGLAIVNLCYQPTFNREYSLLMRKKLGIIDDIPFSSDQFEELLLMLRQAMASSNADYTNTFHALTLFMEEILSGHDLGMIC